MANAGTLTASFNRESKRLLRRKSSEFQEDTKEDIRNLLLSRILVKHQECFPRFVVQSEQDECPPPFGSEYYRYVMPEIGVINGMRLFFEIINEDMPSVNLHREKTRPKTNPPTIVDCEETEELVGAILKSLDRRNLKKVTDPIVVPKGIYVFEFTAQEHSWPGGSERKETVVTVEPFQAKNLKDAVRIFGLWPNGSWYSDLSNFRVCTSEGWSELNFVLRPYCEQWHATLRDYRIIPK